MSILQKTLNETGPYQNKSTKFQNGNWENNWLKKLSDILDLNREGRVTTSRVVGVVKITVICLILTIGRHMYEFLPMSGNNENKPTPHVVWTHVYLSYYVCLGAISTKVQSYNKSIKKIRFQSLPILKKFIKKMKREFSTSNNFFTFIFFKKRRKTVHMNIFSLSISFLLIISKNILIQVQAIKR